MASDTPESPPVDPAPSNPITMLGMLVILLYVVFVGSVVIGFSSYIMRTEWSAILDKENGAVNDIDNLIYLVQRDAYLEQMIEAEQEAINLADTALRTSSQGVRQLDAKRANALIAIEEFMQRSFSYLEGASVHMSDANRHKIEGLVDPESTEIDQQQVRRMLFAVQSMPFGLNSDPRIVSALKENAQALLGEITALEAEHNQISTDLISAESNNQRDDEQRRFHFERQDGHRDALMALRTKVAMDSEHRGRWNALNTGYLSLVLPGLVSTPTILLTLLVTIAAGALGTLVAFSRQTGSLEATDRVAKLLVNMGEGIAAAIGVFLFSGAGMLVLSQGAGSDGGLELSPFTVAFLAFLSGFMAEDAFGKMRAFGSDVFKAKKKDAAAGDDT